MPLLFGNSWCENRVLKECEKELNKLANKRIWIGQSKEIQSTFYEAYIFTSIPVPTCIKDYQLSFSNGTDTILMWIETLIPFLNSLDYYDEQEKLKMETGESFKMKLHYLEKKQDYFCAFYSFSDHMLIKALYAPTAKVIARLPVPRDHVLSLIEMLHPFHRLAKQVVWAWTLEPEKRLQSVADCYYIWQLYILQRLNGCARLFTERFVEEETHRKSILSLSKFLGVNSQILASETVGKYMEEGKISRKFTNNTYMLELVKFMVTNGCDDRK